MYKIIKNTSQRKAYNELSEMDKANIVESFYNGENIRKSFMEMSRDLNVSKRAFSRVLKESGINTKVKRRYEIQNENYFENIDTENKAYFLGLIYADGHVGTNNEIVLSFKAHEDAIRILNILKNELGFSGELSFFLENQKAYSPNSQKVKLNFSNKKNKS